MYTTLGEVLLQAMYQRSSPAAPAAGVALTGSAPAGAAPDTLAPAGPSPAGNALSARDLAQAKSACCGFQPMQPAAYSAASAAEPACAAVSNKAAATPGAAGLCASLHSGVSDQTMLLA